MGGTFDDTPSGRSEKARTSTQSIRLSEGSGRNFKREEYPKTPQSNGVTRRKSSTRTTYPKNDSFTATIDAGTLVVQPRIETEDATYFKISKNKTEGTSLGHEKLTESKSSAKHTLKRSSKADTVATEEATTVYVESGSRKEGLGLDARRTGSYKNTQDSESETLTNAETTTDEWKEIASMPVGEAASNLGGKYADGSVTTGQTFIAEVTQDLWQKQVDRVFSRKTTEITAKEDGTIDHVGEHRSSKGDIDEEVETNEHATTYRKIDFDSVWGSQDENFAGGWEIGYEDGFRDEHILELKTFSGNAVMDGSTFVERSGDLYEFRLAEHIGDSIEERMHVWHSGDGRDQTDFTETTTDTIGESEEESTSYITLAESSPNSNYVHEQSMIEIAIEESGVFTKMETPTSNVVEYRGYRRADEARRNIEDTKTSSDDGKNGTFELIRDQTRNRMAYESAAAPERCEIIHGPANYVCGTSAGLDTTDSIEFEQSKSGYNHTTLLEETNNYQTHHSFHEDDTVTNGEMDSIYHLKDEFTRLDNEWVRNGYGTDNTKANTWLFTQQFNDHLHGSSFSLLPSDDLETYDILAGDINYYYINQKKTNNRKTYRVLKDDRQEHATYSGTESNATGYHFRNLQQIAKYNPHASLGATGSVRRNDSDSWFKTSEVNGEYDDHPGFNAFGTTKQTKKLNDYGWYTPTDTAQVTTSESHLKTNRSAHETGHSYVKNEHGYDNSDVKAYEIYLNAWTTAEKITAPAGGTGGLPVGTTGDSTAPESEQEKVSVAEWVERLSHVTTVDSAQTTETNGVEWIKSTLYDGSVNTDYGDNHTEEIPEAAPVKRTWTQLIAGLPERASRLYHQYQTVTAAVAVTALDVLASTFVDSEYLDPLKEALWEDSGLADTLIPQLTEFGLTIGREVALVYMSGGASIGRMGTTALRVGLFGREAAHFAYNTYQTAVNVADGNMKGALWHGGLAALNAFGVKASWPAARGAFDDITRTAFNKLSKPKSIPIPPRPAQLADDMSLPILKNEKPIGGASNRGLDAIENWRLGGKLYNPAKLDTLSSYLNKRGFKLRLDGDDVLPPNVAAGFDGVKKEIILRRNATELEVFHELSHLRQYQQIGPDAYNALSRIEKEQFVFDLLENSKKRWYGFSEAERLSAIDYILRIGGIR